MIEPWKKEDGKKNMGLCRDQAKIIIVVNVVEGADKGAEAAGFNVADEAELAGHKAEEDDA